MWRLRKASQSLDGDGPQTGQRSNRGRFIQLTGAAKASIQKACFTMTNLLNMKLASFTPPLMWKDKMMAEQQHLAKFS